MDIVLIINLFLINLTIAMVPYASASDDVRPIASTKYGDLRGFRKTVDYHLENSGAITQTVDRFHGIPYAAPPIGNLRFQPPQAPGRWEGVREAREHGWVCPQIIFHPDTSWELQREDCLYLDVYSPYEADKPEARYPVMFYIHGGSFEVGSGRLYDGSVLAQLGVVVVSINYRLGALGFMVSGDESFTGNYGMKDQVEALRWIRDNIANFRGDPDKVTIFGHSAGGASVGLLLVIPETQGLFHAAIGQSGSAIATYSVHEKHKVDFNDYISQVGAIFNCGENSTTHQILDCLREQPADDFISRRNEFPLYHPIDPEFRPYVDGIFIVEHPRHSYIKGKFHRVPIIVGTVENEFGNYFNNGARYNAQFDVALDEYVSRFVSNPAVDKIVNYVYTVWERDIYDRGALLSDMHMVAPTVDMAELVSAHTQDIYQYHFSTYNTYHSVELNYIFGAPFSGVFADEMTINGSVDEFNDKQRQQSLHIMSLWTNFAKFGNPTPEGANQQPMWISFTSSDHQHYMFFNHQRNSIRQKLREDKVVFWNKLLPNIQRQLGKTSSQDMASIGSTKAARSVDNETDNGTMCGSQWIFLGFTVAFALFVILLVIVLVWTTLPNRRKRQRGSPLCEKVDIEDPKTTIQDKSGTAGSSDCTRDYL